jgi:hypothetical protein
MNAFKVYILNSFILLVFMISTALLGCDDDCKKRGCVRSDWSDFPSLVFGSGPISSNAEDICFSFEEIEISECPALAVLEVCEPYLCEGCTSEFCVDFNFPEAFIGCQAIDCHTIDCDGVYDIQVDGYPSWTTIIDEEEVEITCQ